jgi:hypothetical protein
MDAKDRREKLRTSATFNGIDFVEIAGADQTRLRIHFLNAVPVTGTLDPLRPATITGGEVLTTPTVHPVAPGDWGTDDEGHPTLDLSVSAPGDFSTYTVTLFSPVLDPYFDHATFSFKALCPSDLDCAAVPPPCPELPDDAPPIDYLAKDFLSFRKALLDFSALRYPDWVERSEADFGMMFLEALSNLADDLSYTQDRIAAEATLDTATERRSVVRHARLVDYEPKPATAARVLLQLEVTPVPVPTGLLLNAAGPDGEQIFFEIGDGLVDPKTGQLRTAISATDPRWNRWRRNADGAVTLDAGGQPIPNIPPYYWDDNDRCLRAGSTELWVQGQGFGFQVGDVAHGILGTAILIDTRAETSADPPVREYVHLTGADERTDPLYDVPLTRLRWSADEKPRFDHDLTRTTIAGNLVPATQGRRYTEAFVIETPPTANPFIPRAIARTGPNATPDSPIPQYLFTLAHSPVAWLMESDPAARPTPEIVLMERAKPPATDPTPWRWRRILLDAQPFESAFTVDPARFRPIGQFPDGRALYDYDNDAGETIRFGDGTFGDLPEPDAQFQVTYRAGGGLAGNVAADTITAFDPAAAVFILVATNPFPATGGTDPETSEQVRRRAPQAFRRQQFRAVRPADYEAAAKSLPWVQNAGTAFRWTGSWLTVFTTVDPRESEQITVTEHTELINLLNRRRLAGYESYTPAPRFVSLDLIVTVCARPDAFRGDVAAELLTRLSASPLPDGTMGFFFPDRLTFGTPLERSTLEAAIQRTYGVAGVVSIRYRQRGSFRDYREMPDQVLVHFDEILRVDNDPSTPERGSLRVHVEGGK